MRPQRFYYLIKIQYLGYRLHGWQTQPGIKTVEGMIRKTLRFVLEKRKFKILGASRTDAMVSAHQAAFELFLDQAPLENMADFLTIFNENLPQDIRALSIEEVDAKFNIIQHPKTKEYLYLFAFGRKSHPFAAPLLATFLDKLDIEMMMAGAKKFQGSHSFHNYCTKATAHTLVERTIDFCGLELNQEVKASFFPDRTYVLRVKGSGFLRNQIRLMMGALVLVGKGEWTLEELEQSLFPEERRPVKFIAPGSGLMLNKIDFHLK